MKNGNVIQQGKKQPTKYYYLAWLVGIIISISILIKNNFKKIDWIIIIPFLWIGLISSYLWQTIHNYFPQDLDRSISGWMFYKELIITNKLFLGGVFEDIVLFHPLGLLFGSLLCLYFFKVFKPYKLNKTVTLVFFIILIIYLTIMCFIIDYSSKISFFIFILPSIPCIILSYKYINLERFIIFFISMLVFTFIWDYTSVILTEKLFGETARCWFYVKDGLHSLVYSNNPKYWIFDKLPVSIDIIYPCSGMLFMIGIIGFIKYLRKDVE